MTPDAEPANDRDLVLHRFNDASPDKLYRAWTEPERLKRSWKACRRL